MKLRNLILAVIVALGCLTGCVPSTQPDVAEMVSKTLSVKGSFDRISLSTGVPVEYIVNDKATEVKVKGSSEYVDALNVSVRGSELRISIKKKNGVTINGSTLLPLQVNGPALKSINVSSGARIEVENGMDLGNAKLSLNASSGAAVEADEGIVCGGMDMNCSSGARVELKKVIVNGHVSVNASSGAMIELEDLMQSGTIDVDASSGAHVTLGGYADSASLKSTSAASITLTNLKTKE